LLTNTGSSSANIFNFLRLLFALSVIISHSYDLSGTPGGDYLNRITGGQVTFSHIGLCGFFVISGYWVFRSLERSKGLKDYFKKRALRIYPGLAVMLLLTVLLGAFVYERDLYGYLTNVSAWTYLPKNLSIFKSQGKIDGIFTDSVYNPTINGSLWSLLYEVSFYIVLAVLFFFRKRIQLSVVVILLTFLLTTRFFAYEQSLERRFILEAHLVLLFAPFFFAGVLLALIKAEQWPFRRWIMIILVVVLTGFTIAGQFHVVSYFTLPLIVILLGFTSWPAMHRLLSANRLGDISYGVYIYSFPVQQTLMHYFKFNAIELMVSSLIISVALGFLSWHLVEKRALKLK
jgi:peptidoglycan/LPS O-acetylase OafA/YrhL